MYVVFNITILTICEGALCIADRMKCITFNMYFRDVFKAWFIHARFISIFNNIHSPECKVTWNILSKFQFKFFLNISKFLRNEFILCISRRHRILSTLLFGFLLLHLLLREARVFVIFNPGAFNYEWKKVRECRNAELHCKWKIHKFTRSNVIFLSMERIAFNIYMIFLRYSIDFKNISPYEASKNSTYGFMSSNMSTTCVRWSRFSASFESSLLLFLISEAYCFSLMPS
jgi:hypothetical protein